MENVGSILEAAARQIHRESRNDGRARYTGKEWDRNSMLTYYIEKEMTLEAALKLVHRSGYVIIPKSQVVKAWRPPKRHMIARQVLRISDGEGELSL